MITVSQHRLELRGYDNSKPSWGLEMGGYDSSETSWGLEMGGYDNSEPTQAGTGRMP